MASIYDLTFPKNNGLGVAGTLPASSFDATQPVLTGSNYGFTSGISSPGIGLKPGFSLGNNLGNVGAGSGGFFGNGLDLGFNAPTANLAMNGIGGILQLLGANQARKSLEAQQRVAEENLAMTKKAYDTNIDRKYLAAAHQAGKTDDEARAYADSALSRYGTGSILATRNLDRKTQEG